MLILANRLDGGLDDSLSPHSTVVRPHVSDVSPQIMSSSYSSLPVRFDHIFSKTSLGICFGLLHRPQIFLQLIEPQSLSKSYGGEF